MNRFFYALGLLACCNAVLLAGEVDPEKRGGTARSQQPAGSAAAGSSSAPAGTVGAAPPMVRAGKEFEIKQLTGTVIKKSGSEIKIKTKDAEKVAK